MASIRFTLSTLDDSSVGNTHCSVLPISENRKLDRYGKALDRDSGGVVKKALETGDFTAKAGSTLMLHAPGASRRILLVGCGEGRERDSLRKAVDGAAAALLRSKAENATLHVGPLKVRSTDWLWFCTTLARGVVYASYRYSATLSKAAELPPLKRLTVLATETQTTADARKALKRGLHTGEGINLARELADLPGNHCTPDYLASVARKLARSSDKTSCKVLNEKAMGELGMNSLLSVTAGTATPARLIIVEYRGGKKSEAPHVLVGKGITFDSGGISLKPGAKMDEMKYDMGGAASVLGTLQAVQALQLPINVVGIIAAAENMPSGTATKPGDVVTSMSGITIEILNTDAEGRLVLCDALTYAERYKPQSVVDIATLTGACVVALGHHASGLYSNQEQLAEKLLSAGVESHDRAWHMPLWDDYQKQLDSNFADVGNIGGPGAGSVTAACFLSRFTKAYDWAHLDIAGAAWESSPKGATGRPVGLLTQYLCSEAGNA